MSDDEEIAQKCSFFALQFCKRGLMDYKLIGLYIFRSFNHSFRIMIHLLFMGFICRVFYVVWILIEHLMQFVLMASINRIINHSALRLFYRITITILNIFFFWIGGEGFA